MAYVKDAARLLDFDDVAAFNEALDGNEKLKAGLDRLVRAMPAMTKQEYADEMLLLFKEAGIFITQPELEKLLLLRRQTDMMLLGQEGESRQNSGESKKK